MDPQTGGPCQMIRNFAPSFMEQGHILEVVCLNDARADFLGHDPFPVHAVGQGRGAWNYHAGLTPWLRQNLCKYDAAILNGLWQFQGYSLWQASKRPDAPPYFLYPHGMLDPWFQKLSVRPVKAVRNVMMWKTFQHRIIHRAAGLLFTCEEERRLARLPFKPYRPRLESVVGLGVPQPPAPTPRMASAFAEKCPGTKGEKYFLFLGRVHPKKGVDLLIKGYAALCDSVSKAEQAKLPRLVIAGPDLETAYGQEMQKLAAQICPSNSVFWPGMLKGDAKWGAIYGCEVFALISHQENFGIAVVEALACGKPVLISSQINIWREIEDDKAGLVRGDTTTGATELFQEWKKLSADKLAAMQQAAKRCYLNHFGPDLATRRLIETIEKCTKATGTKSEPKPVHG